MLDRGVLRFGDFTLKSGRKSPYFFDLGLIASGDGLREIGMYFAEKAIQLELDCDVIYGPAYKGIPLAVAMSIAMSQQDRVIATAFNRKEVKDHGEGGIFVGAEMKDKRVLIVDDVVSQGVQKQESIRQIREAKGNIEGVLVAFDREELEEGTDMTAMEAVSRNLGVPFYRIATLSDVIQHLARDAAYARDLKSITHYREKYCKGA